MPGSAARRRSPVSGRDRARAGDRIGLRGVAAWRPSGWKSVGARPARAGPQPDGPDAARHPVGARDRVKDMWPALLPQLQLSEYTRAPWARRDGDDRPALDAVPGAPRRQGLIADVASPSTPGAHTWWCWSRRPPRRRELHDGVFLPAVDAFALVTAVSSPGASGVTAAVCRQRRSRSRVVPRTSPWRGRSRLPAGDGPFPAIVLVTGSGPQDRDESLAPIAAIKPFAIIADALARAGVAVLRFDDRGPRSRPATTAPVPCTDFTADAAAAVAFLRTRTDVDQAHVGLLGHSEGGIDVAEIAAADPSIAFVVGMAAAGDRRRRPAGGPERGDHPGGRAPATPRSRSRSSSRADVFERVLAATRPAAEQVDPGLCRRPLRPPDARCPAADRAIARHISRRRSTPG